MDQIQLPSDQCACKGIRKCLICSPMLLEETSSLNLNLISNGKMFIYCVKCCHAVKLSTKNLNVIENFLRNSSVNNLIDCFCQVIDHDDTMRVDGIFIKNDFITSDEEVYLRNEMNNSIWNESQSGRFKQDFGPKANFNKKKLKHSAFSGLPFYSKFLVERMNQTYVKNFQPVEMCNLKYDRKRAACIDPHFDDFWLWGERLVTINLLENTYLTLIPGNDIEKSDIEILLPMERRSLLVLSSEARYKWKHAIKNTHISSIRIAMTFRELSQHFSDNKEDNTSKEIEKLAFSFKGCPVGLVEKVMLDFKNNPFTEDKKNQILLNFDQNLKDKLSNCLDEQFVTYDILKQGTNYLTILANSNFVVKIRKIILRSNFDVSMAESFINLTKIIKKVLNIELDGYILEVICQKYININKNFDLYADDFLFNVGKKVAEWRLNISNKIESFNVLDYNQENNLENLIWLKTNFEAYKTHYFYKINSSKLDSSTKTKAIALLFNLNRLIGQKETKKGLILSDFRPNKIVLTDEEKLVNLSTFKNISYSFYLNDLAICQANFIFHHSFNRENMKLSKVIAMKLYDGYQSIFKLDPVDTELLYNLILFNLIIIYINLETNFSQSKTSNPIFNNEMFCLLIENIYLDTNFLF